MLTTLDELGYKNMTDIQAKTLPLTLNNKDVIAQAKTGSGKTAAFSIAVLTKLKVKKFRIQSMILAPTRELADQIAKELKSIARFKHNIKITTLCGGVSYKPQVHSLSHQAHIIVGTPGRILKHLEEESFSTEDIETLVLDEADRMLDMGFFEDIEKVISYLPKQRQTLLFSATYPPQIEQLSKNILYNPTKIEVETVHNQTVIKQSFYEAENENKLTMVLDLFNMYKPASVLIFCNTKIQCDTLADDLEDNNLSPLVLHSDLDQRDRNETLILFSNKSYPILIATDVASRGLDIDDISLVINYDLPNSSEIYTHRIGRTARAGKNGSATSLVNSYDLEIFNDIQEDLDMNAILEESKDITFTTKYDFQSYFTTLFINGGKKQKLRAGDILGALTAGIGLSKEEIGKIDILDFCSFVAVDSKIVQKALDGLSNSRIKGKYFKIYKK